LRGQASASSGTAIGVSGTSAGTNGLGVGGHGTTGVYGFATTGSGTGVYGQNLGGNAGFFWGNVAVTGTLSKGGGSFKIDHPLDPANRYLYHSFVESPDMKNIYDGVAVLDANGQAVVQLPDWFEALNRDFRYQLTCIGGFAPVYIAREISGNQFTIAGGAPRQKVSWQVTGIRKDGFAEKYRIPVEEDKPANERGYYLHPDVYQQPETKGIEWARNPELMKQRQEGENLSQASQPR
jgi:hypothetical protein